MEKKGGGGGVENRLEEKKRLSLEESKWRQWEMRIGQHRTKHRERKKQKKQKVKKLLYIFRQQRQNCEQPK